MGYSITKVQETTEALETYAKESLKEMMIGISVKRIITEL